jgi:uncharacterized protein YcgI (DUF1989 family)
MFNWPDAELWPSVTVEGGSGRAVRMAAGQRVGVVNTHGQQVVDTWAVTLTGERYLSMSHTRLAIGRLSPTAGDVLVDDQRQPILALVCDESPGGHDTLIPACDARRYRALGFQGYHPSCADNYAHALAGTGLGASARTPDPLNLFMAVDLSAAGELALVPSAAQAGARVVFEALQDLVLVVSACPQDLVPINGADGPRRVQLFIEGPASGTALGA